MLTRLHYWLLRHPRVGRPLKVLLVLQTISAALTAMAPPAFAASNASALDWTGVKDSYEVPIGSYYLAAVDLWKNAKAQAPNVTLDPTTWLEWVTDTTSSMIEGSVAVFFLTCEAGLFIGMLAIAVWVYRLAAKSWWLSFFGTLIRPGVDAVFIAIDKVGLVAWLLPIAVFAGAWVVAIRGGKAQGWMMIMSAFMVLIIGIAVLSDPVTLMYGEHGLLATGRDTAFKVSEIATHNGGYTTAYPMDTESGPPQPAPADAAAQLDVFSGDLITAVARHPFQLWQYGHVLSGSCDVAWSQAMKDHPSEDAPVTAMVQCGDLAAAKHAGELNGNNVWLGLLLCAAAFLFMLFLLMAAGALVMVPARAMYRVYKLPADVKVGILDGGPRDYMKQALLTFFIFLPLEMFVYTLFICTSGMAVGKVMTGPLPPDLGGSNPVAKMLMFAASAMVSISLFRTIQAEMFGLTRPQGHVSRLAWGVAGAAASALGAKGVSSGIKALQARRAHRSAPPWEDLESKVASIADSLGASHAGFDTITSPSSTSGSVQEGRTLTGGDGDSGVSLGASPEQRPVPQPTTLTRPQGRGNTGGPGRKERGGRVGRTPSVAGQRSRPVPAVSTAGGEASGGAVMDTITKDPGGVQGPRQQPLDFGGPQEPPAQSGPEQGTHL
ncbi:proline-rich domain-containing protein [Mycobacteroides abscessus]|uniref:proline-rich domain-containing protein n=1 Tax=Mycobacteroides abscessus TaxID=36809 RepID=UPI0009A59474|nr:proline-rich domain-containing protein [Mycobacteroides abscessus]SLC86666.1 Uncharacterised protein [Mycobacteroides abscessus subsp. abscessus]SLG75573.1 Uncharacterised protein [Mycobacteroides abscessus subsp. abscessus]